MSHTGHGGKRRQAGRPTIYKSPGVPSSLRLPDSFWQALSSDPKLSRAGYLVAALRGDMKKIVKLRRALV